MAIYFRSIIPFLLLTFYCFTSNGQDNNSGKTIVRACADKCLSLKTVRFKLKIQERLYGKIKHSESMSKVSYLPLKLYIKQVKPKEGLEVLYCEGERKNMALIYTNGFPWVNVTFSPYSNSMHKESHHNVTHSGLKYVGKMLDYFLKNMTAEDIVKKENDEILNGKECYKITVEKKNFHYFPYTVKKGETIHTIADKHMITSYIILENNLSVIDDYDEALVEGEKLLIPNSYGKKMTLWIEKKTSFPIKLIVEDDKGFFESYEYSDIQVNVTFKEDEFSEDFEDYGF